MPYIGNSKTMRMPKSRDYFCGCQSVKMHQCIPSSIVAEKTKVIGLECVLEGFCENCSDKAYYIRESVAKHCSICEINKSVFFTSEEADAKLKEMEEKDGR